LSVLQLFTIRKMLLASVLLALLIASATPALAAAPATQDTPPRSPDVPLTKGTGVITGTLTNGTTGAPMPDLTVVLRIFDGTNPLEIRQATADAAGVYRFEELPTDATLTYAVIADYPPGAGVPYGTEPTGFQSGQTTLNLPLTVYETTADSAGVRADRVHFIVEFDAGQLLVAELYVFSLDGNRAYVGDGAGSLRFSLPQSAQGLAVSGGELGGRYLQTRDGFVDTLPLPPGQGVRQVLFRYALPITGGKLELARTLPYPAANVNALIAETGVQVSSPQLPAKGMRQTEYGNYITLSGQNLAAGQPITLLFTGLTTVATGAASVPAGIAPVILLIAMGLVGVAAGLLAAWPLLRRRPAGAAAAGADGLSREALIDALARLDLAHEVGKLSDAAYRDQRLRLKAQLMDLARTESRQVKPRHDEH
jgi:hypothetical protein